MTDTILGLPLILIFILLFLLLLLRPFISLGQKWGELE